MSDIATRMRKARQSTVKIDKYTFTIIRPTDVEAGRLWSDDSYADMPSVAKKFTVGWEGVTEANLLVSGGSDPVEFERDAWEAWCDDNQDFWKPLWTAILESYQSHQKRREDAGKN